MPAELSLGAVETNLLTIAIDKLVNTPAMKVTTSQKNATIPKAFKASYRKYIFNLPKELSFPSVPDGLSRNLPRNKNQLALL